MKSRILSVFVLLLVLLTACNGLSGEIPASGTPTDEPTDEHIPAAGASSLTVSAAADLTPAFQELGDIFTTQTGVQVVFNFGSTGQLAQQIEQGAPVDIFAAANQSYIEDLQEAGFVIPDTVALYAQGRITLWTRSDGARTFDGLDDLAPTEVRRIAIANPDHAPYGVAAREALQSAGLWDAVQPRLILGENVAQTLQYAQTGNVDVAIVALSLSIASGDEGRWTLIPGDLHQPLNQALAVISGTQHEAQARQFAAFVNSEEGRVVMRRYGFVLPGEDPVQ